MKVVKFSCLLSFVLLGLLCSCRQQEQEDTSNRSYFTFDLTDRKLAIPVQLNDSVTVKLLFDTGAGLEYYDELKHWIAAFCRRIRWRLKNIYNVEDLVVLHGVKIESRPYIMILCI